ncbi:MAG: IS5/IS1182 family transposase, partial [Meiothermus silvanus]|nr:IS5/IS1182 family transposase [Allomeiothermus silvanus]
RGVGSRDLIPLVRRRGALKATERKARAELVSQARLDGLFGQRWKSETVISVLKRKFGEGVRSRKPRLQMRECRVKALVYNAYR